MPTLAEMDWDEFYKEQQALFPTAYYGKRDGLTSSLVVDFQNALDEGSEEAIQKFLTQNPYLIQYALETSGHHGVWVYPKQMIKMAAADGSKGMIPDFLVASKSSLGYFWHIVEIKRFQDQFSNKRGDGLSPVGNKALTQCNKYLGHVSDYIDAVRSNIKVVDFVAPVRCVLLMGNSLNETDAQRICRANYDRQNSNIDVVSYHRLIGGLQLDTKPLIRS